MILYPYGKQSSMIMSTIKNKLFSFRIFSKKPIFVKRGRVFQKVERDRESENKYSIIMQHGFIILNIKIRYVNTVFHNNY